MQKTLREQKRVIPNIFQNKYKSYTNTNVLCHEKRPRRKSAPLCRRVLQTKTVSGQALENQRVYI